VVGGREHAVRGQERGLRVLRRRISEDVELEHAEITLGVDHAEWARKRRIGDEADARRVETEPRQRDRRPDIGVLRISARRLARARLEEGGRGADAREIDDALGRRPAPGLGRLRRDVDDAAKTGRACGDQAVDAGDGAGWDQDARGTSCPGAEPRHERRIGEGADRRDDEIGAAGEDRAPVLGDRGVAGAFEDELRPAGERAGIGEDGEPARRLGATVGLLRRTHEDARDTAGLALPRQHAHDLARDRAIADDAELRACRRRRRSPVHARFLRVAG